MNKKLKKYEFGFYENLMIKGFNLVPIKEIIIKNIKGYKPSFLWKKEVFSLDNLKPYYSNLQTVTFGLQTGFNDVECVDVDTKIFSSIKEKKEFWIEYLELLENHIPEFKKKVLIIETKTGGFHILYKTKIKEGNKKIAKPKGYKEALIESRGVGGFVYIHDKIINNKRYHEIDYITDEERNMIWQISKTYNHEEPVIVKQKKRQTILKSGITPWEDFAQKNSILDVCSDEFDIVGHGRKSQLIRRKGASSAHSGYIFDLSGKMFLFSTGTIYPHEKPLNSFDVYTIKHHRGDYSEATKKVYELGYGARYEAKPVEFSLAEIKENIVFPLEIYPKEIQFYITECSRVLNASPDFMGCAFLWLLSTLVGNTMKVSPKNAWVDSPIIWLSIIGKAGVGKTPDLNLIIKPLQDLNKQEILRYRQKDEEYTEAEKQSKEDKDINGFDDKSKPTRTQFLADDVTVEGLIKLHEESPKSIGIFKDELAGWFNDMNKYRQGSDKQFWLSAFNGDTYSATRKTAGDSFLANPFLPLIGGIQPEIFYNVQTKENQDSGFMDRMLFCDPNKIAKHPTNEELSNELIEMYRNYVFQIKEVVDHSLYREDEKGDINPFIIKFSNKAKKQFHKVHCEIIDRMNSDSELDFFRGIFAKQITYIPRFALLISFINGLKEQKLGEEISEIDIKKAEKLSNYFIDMAKNSKSIKDTSATLEEFIANNKTKKKKDLAVLIFENFPNIKKSTIAEKLNTTRKTIYNYLKQC